MKQRTDFKHIELGAMKTARDRANGRTATCWATNLTQGRLRGSSQAMDQDEDQAPPPWNATSCTRRDQTRYMFTMFYVLHDVCSQYPSYCGPRQCTRYAMQAFIIKYIHLLSRLLTCSYVHVHGGRQRRLPTQGLKNAHDLHLKIKA